MTGLRRILLAQTSFLGDVVLTTPLARLLSEALPEAEVWWLVRPDAVGLIAPLAGEGRVCVLDKRGADRGLVGLWAAAARLRALRFDAAIGVQRSLRTALLLALARVPLRIGFRGSPGAWLYHRRVARCGAHARDRILALAGALGLGAAPTQPAPQLGVDPRAAAQVDALLGAAGVGPGERLLALAPGSAWATKRWPARRFAEAARMLVPEHLDRVVVVGAPADRPLASEIAALLADPQRGERAGGGPVGSEQAGRPPVAGGVASSVVDLCGQTSTAELVALLGRAALVIANDSAPAHVAAALGRPLVALFGPTVTTQGFAPLGMRVRIAERELACRPCSRHGTEHCPIGTHACLAELPESAVVAAALELLGPPLAARRPVVEGLP